MPQVGQLASANATESLLDARSEKLLGQVKASRNSPNPKLERAAKAFESILLDKWLEDAQHSFATVPGQDPDKNDDGNAGADQYRSLAMQALSEKLTASGGIGIATMIMHKLESKPQTPIGLTTDSKDVSGQSTNEVLLPRNRIKVSSGKDR